MITILCTLIICYLVLFIVAYYIQDNSIVDIFWWLGFLVVAWISFFQQWDFSVDKIAILLVITLWSLRISWSILAKKIHKPWEDARYWTWRKEWKHFYLRSFFQVYLLQMVLLLIISSFIYIIFSSTGGNNILVFACLFLSLAWLWYEAIADSQVLKYIKTTSQKNMIFTQGLYKYSRHPNYFWEIIFWFWILLISFQYSFYWVIWFWVLVFLLIKVSWIPMKEIRYKKKSNWPEYSKKTPLFFPNFWNK